MTIDNNVEGKVGVERQAIASYKSASLQMPCELVKDGLLQKAKDSDGLQKIIEVVVEATTIVIATSGRDVRIEIEAFIPSEWYFAEPFVLIEVTIAEPDESRDERREKE